MPNTVFTLTLGLEQALHVASERHRAGRLDEAQPIYLALLWKDMITLMQGEVLVHKGAASTGHCSPSSVHRRGPTPQWQV